MGKIFKNLIIAHTNDFSTSKNDKIKGWIENNGGAFSRDITPDVTHLLASPHSWKRYDPIVKKARQLRVPIVKLAWLEDSLMQNKPKKKTEADYTYEQTKVTKRKRGKRIKRQGPTDSDLAPDHRPDKIETSSTEAKAISEASKIERAGIEFDETCHAFVKEMAGIGFHPYVDKNKFVYMIKLVREDNLNGLLETYKLQLYECDRQPYTYACTTHFSQPGRTKTMQVELAPAGSTWDFAWDTFRKFFQRRCGGEWSTVTGGHQVIDLDGEQEGFFHYEPANSTELARSDAEVQEREQGVRERHSGNLTINHLDESKELRIDYGTSEDHDIEDAHLP